MKGSKVPAGIGILTSVPLLFCFSDSFGEPSSKFFIAEKSRESILNLSGRIVTPSGGGIGSSFHRPDVSAAAASLLTLSVLFEAVFVIFFVQDAKKIMKTMINDP